MEMGSGTCFITLFQFPSIMRPSLFVPVPDFVHNHHPRHVALWASGCGVKTEVIFSSSGYKLHGAGSWKWHQVMTSSWHVEITRLGERSASLLACSLYVLLLGEKKNLLRIIKDDPWEILT